jgi:hypothetical protein
LTEHGGHFSDRYDVTESNAFERAMRERPHFWSSEVRPVSGEVRVCANPCAAAHRAAEALMRARPTDAHGSLEVSWRCLEHAEPPPGALQVRDRTSLLISARLT